MKTPSYFYKLTFSLLVAILAATGGNAQSINVLGIAHGTASANIKAEVDLAGKTIGSVTGRTFKMSDGSSTTRDTYQLFDGRYIIADLDYTPGSDYFYRLEIEFTDGTSVMTDCFNESYTEGAVWLSDLPESCITVNTVGAYGIDKCADGRPMQIHPTSIFHKGISTYTEEATSSGKRAQLIYDVSNLGHTFTYTRFSMGLQAFKPDGSNSVGYARMIVMLNGAETSSRGNMYSYSNPSRKSNAPYYFDQTQAAATGIKTLGLSFYDIGGGYTDDFCNLAACRLYYTVDAPAKEAQSVVFDNEGGTIFSNSPTVDLSAYATGGTPVYFTLVQGSDIAAIEDGHILVPTPGKRGQIVVEALTLGDNTYAPASSTRTFNFNFGPTVEYLYTHPHAENSNKQTIYLYVDPLDRKLEKLSLEIYDDVRTYRHLKTVDLLAGLDGAKTAIDNVYAVETDAPEGTCVVHRLTYKFEGEDEVVGHLSEGDNPYIYMTDLPEPPTVRPGYGTAVIDGSYNHVGDLCNTRHPLYGKGYGIHAAGWVETNTATDLSQFSRFVVDLGGQVITNPSRGKLNYDLYNGLTTAELSSGNVDWQQVFEWDYQIKNTGVGKTIRVAFGAGGDGNRNDVVCIGAPRLYYRTQPHNSQTVQWISEVVINNYRPFSQKLTATSTSGLPVLYRISQGSEFARIVDNDQIFFYNIPDEGQVVVEAFQPGDKEYAHSNVCTCVFRIRRAFIIQADERVELEGGHDIDELIVYANAGSAGQAVVSDGVVNVRKLVLKYTFTPGEWNFIAFPSDFDIDAISDLEDKGFSFATQEGIPGTYLISEYDTRVRAENPDESPWKSLAQPKVRGLKGYIMKLENGDNGSPVEITFNMDNIHLDFDSTIKPMYLSLDLTQCMPESRHTVYVRPSNVKGNTLRVDVRFSPSDLTGLPVNHAKALEDMRVTRTPLRGAIRLTLPEQTPARVAIFDRDGSRLRKAVRYISPMKIDISDLDPGTYRMVVVYGPASREMLVEL